MAYRRLLTSDYLKGLEAPVAGEYWVADTLIRGFGIRVWKTGGETRFSFAIRKTDTGGRSIRKSFGLSEAQMAAFETGNYFWPSSRSELYTKDLADFLPEARQWARVEIAKLQGRLESDAELDAAREEEKRQRARAGEYVAALPLEHCVLKVIELGAYRNWTAGYRDRLLTAYYAFDRETHCGQCTMAELADGRIESFIEESNIGLGNLRLFRSLLKVVAENVHALGGPPYGRVLPMRGVRPRTERAAEFLDTLEYEDFEALLAGLRSSGHNWRATLSIEIAFYFHTPFSRILSGRWLEIEEDRWYPYREGERKYWRGKFERIDGAALDCLTLARRGAMAEGVRSDLWFPSSADPGKPLRNVDRAWASSLQRQGWPPLSLGQALKHYRGRFWYKNFWN